MNFIQFFVQVHNTEMKREGFIHILKRVSVPASTFTHPRSSPFVFPLQRCQEESEVWAVLLHHFLYRASEPIFFFLSKVKVTHYA